MKSGHSGRNQPNGLVAVAKLARAFAGLLLLWCMGCEQEAEHPWDAADAAAPTTSWSGPVPQAPGSSPAASASGGSPTSTAPKPQATVPGARGPVRVGGPWVACYGDFRPTGEVVKDVTRLALMCGPANGMRRLGDKATTGPVSEGAPPLSGQFTARKGGCYRVFAVATEDIADLDIVVRSPRGKIVARDHGQDRWPILHPDRPFCALEDGELTVELTSNQGSGNAAAEVWELYQASK